MVILLLKFDSLKIGNIFDNKYYQADTERTAPMYVTLCYDVCNDKYLRCAHLLNGTNILVR